MSLGPWSTDDAGIPMIERIIRMHVQTAVLRGGAKATNKAIREIMSVVRYAVKQEPAPQEDAGAGVGLNEDYVEALLKATWRLSEDEGRVEVRRILAAALRAQPQRVDVEAIVREYGAVCRSVGVGYLGADLGEILRKHLYASSAPETRGEE